ncbi:MAG: FAD:protein FMN transferase [Lachnospiraceae bacterium]|nr:FAD:protein FMN transferase [Lachnospiraceae bacterium]
MKTYTGTDLLMGTVLSMKVESGDGDPWKTLYAMGQDLETRELSWRIEGSEVWRINAAAGDPEGLELSPEMEEILTRCLAVSEESGGAFDITLGALTQLWDLDRAALEMQEAGSGAESTEPVYTPPSDEEVRAALARCGYEKVRIEEHRIYLPEGMRIDLGAVGKGIFLGHAADALQEAPISGTISAGGSILTLGNKNRSEPSEPWNIGIVDPADPSQLAGAIPVPGGSFVSTSGDYERYVEADGVRYHHLLDPHTGYPVGVKRPVSGGAEINYAVTIVCTDGLLSDALSTACFVIANDPERGPQQARELAERFGAQMYLVGADGIL